MTGVRWLVDAYAEWVAAEAVPVAPGLGVDLTTVPTAPWARMGVDATFVQLEAQDDFTSTYLLDIAPGKATERQRHLYEANVYVVDGEGSTVMEHPDGSRRSFEWHRGSLFAVPVNMPYRIFNSS